MKFVPTVFAARQFINHGHILVKGYYGNISERQFRRYYDEAVRRRGDTGENLIELLDAASTLRFTA